MSDEVKVSDGSQTQRTETVRVTMAGHMGPGMTVGSGRSRDAQRHLPQRPQSFLGDHAVDAPPLVPRQGPRQGTAGEGR